MPISRIVSKGDGELAKIRNMGEKSLALALAMRDKYANESNIRREDMK